MAWLYGLKYIRLAMAAHTPGSLYWRKLRCKGSPIRIAATIGISSIGAPKRARVALFALAPAIYRKHDNTIKNVPAYHNNHSSTINNKDQLSPYRSSPPYHNSRPMRKATKNAAYSTSRSGLKNERRACIH